MEKHGTVILQDNIRRTEELAEAFEKSGNFTVLGKTIDGEEGVNLVLKTGAEYCVIDLILQNLDGLGFLERVKNTGADVKTVVFSSLCSEEVIDTCIMKGAAFFVAKPCAAETLVKRVEDVFLTDGVQPVRKIKNPSLDEKISKIFISVGIPPHIKGYSYLREGIKMAVESPDVINNITKKLYPMIGEKYSTTPSKV
ncbi:MAG: sporulation initiation factor Spo0A C-terminal domain-containing protein, partial [Christensenellaceae bacterium]